MSELSDVEPDDIPSPLLRGALGLLEQLHKRGEPVVLTINDTVRLTIRDNATFEQFATPKFHDG